MIETIYFFIGFILGLILDRLIVLYYRGKSKFTFFGNRIHHTVHGLAAIVISFFVWRFFFLGLGTGLIFWHTIRLKRLVFVEWRKK